MVSNRQDRHLARFPPGTQQTNLSRSDSAINTHNSGVISVAVLYACCIGPGAAVASQPVGHVMPQMYAIVLLIAIVLDLLIS